MNSHNGQSTKDMDLYPIPKKEKKKILKEIEKMKKKINRKVEPKFLNVIEEGKNNFRKRS